MNAVIRRDIERDIGGDSQRIHHVNTKHADITFKHILLPMWLAAYRYRDETYRIVVNARTGAVQGERPWSWVKIGLAIAAGVVVAAAFCMSRPKAACSTTSPAARSASVRSDAVASTPRRLDR